MTLLLLAIAGCDTGDDLLLVAHGPSASPTPDAGEVGGNVSGGSTTPMASLVLIAPDVDAITLNAPAADGSTPARYPNSRALSAKVWLYTGETDPLGVTWSSSVPEAVEVSPQGLVTVKPGASGSAIVTAASVRNPQMTDELVVSITTDGKLKLSVFPTLSHDEEDRAQTRLELTQNGVLIDTPTLTNELALALAAGTYRLAITRTGNGPSVSWVSENVQVTPNGVTAIAAQLQ